MQAPGKVIRQRQFERSHCISQVIFLMDNITITYATVALRVPKSSKFKTIIPFAQEVTASCINLHIRRIAYGFTE